MLSKKIKIIIVFYLLLLSFKTHAKEIKSSNIQLINSLNQSQGEAFGYKNKKLTINNFAELPITLNNSLGANILSSATNAKSDDKSNQYALNSLEFFHRYRFFSNKFCCTIVETYVYLYVMWIISANCLFCYVVVSLFAYLPVLIDTKTLFTITNRHKNIIYTYYN